MRWADLDLLGHVNNVVYVDYLQEARVDMLRAHGRGEPTHTDELAEGVVVVRHEVTYVSPLEFGYRPVRIESWVTQVRAATFTIAYEIFHDLPDGNRRVYARANTVLTPYVFADERPRRITPEERESLSVFFEPAEPREPGPTPRMPTVRPENAAHYPVQVRFSDVDVYRHVNNVKYFEYLQESRISMNSRLWKGLDPISIVVAQTDVDYRQPIVFRPEAYDAWSWLSRVGQRSATIDSLMQDGGTVLARARVTIVFFDPQTGRSIEPAQEYLDRMRELQPA